MSAMGKSDNASTEQNGESKSCGEGLDRWHSVANLGGFPSWPVFVHVALVVVAVWFAGVFQYNLIVVMGIAVLYLRQVYYIERKRAFEEAKMSLKMDAIRAKMTDMETVVWLNGILQKAWGIWLERFASEQLIMKVAPWFLDQYKPWALKSLKLKAMNLGSVPPVVETARLHRVGSDTEDVVLEMDVSFAAAHDMFVTVVSKLTKPGLSFPCVVSKVALAGKVRVGVMYLSDFPFVRRVSVCFVSSPSLSMKVNVLKSSLSRGFDVASLPLVASLVDKTVEKVLGESLIAPNMLIVDIPEVLAAAGNSHTEIAQNEIPLMSTSSKPSGDLKVPQEMMLAQSSRVKSTAITKPVASLLLEIIEGRNLKAADMTGLSDPFVKVTLGRHKRRTKVIQQTLNPKWDQEFLLPIASWNSPRHPLHLTLKVMDHDGWKHDDKLGDCSIDLADFRDGNRADFWVKLDNVNRGEIHIAVAIIENSSDNVGGDGNKDCHMPNLTEKVTEASPPPDSTKPTVTMDNKAVAIGTKRERHDSPSLLSQSESLKRCSRLTHSSSLKVKHRRTVSLGRPSALGPLAKPEPLRAYSNVISAKGSLGTSRPLSSPVTEAIKEFKESEAFLGTPDDPVDLMSPEGTPPPCRTPSTDSNATTPRQDDHKCKEACAGPHIIHICPGVKLYTWHSDPKVRTLNQRSSAS